MQIGLCPIATLNINSVDCQTNDRLRLDGHRNAVCLSIAHPNEKMFAKYRWADHNKNWVVLVLDASILWKADAAFCRHNAADIRISKQPLSTLKTVSAFDSMFLQSDDLPARKDSNLMMYDPSDVQAEVLVFDIVPPELIKGVVVSDGLCLEAHRSAVAERRVSINAEGKGFFGTRSNARKVGWSH